jgi:hypothetical protein
VYDVVILLVQCLLMLAVTLSAAFIVDVNIVVKSTFVHPPVNWYSAECNTFHGDTMKDH